MLVFNCSKAATEYLTRKQLTGKQRGKKWTCVKKAPSQSIAEAIDEPIFPSDFSEQEHGHFQWQWLLHLVTIDEQNFWLVMDYLSRYCLVFDAGKRGDECDFLNRFEYHIKPNIFALMAGQELSEQALDSFIEGYDQKVHTCIFYQRSDRSCQAHLRDVSQQLAFHVQDVGGFSEDAEFLGFSLYLGECFRTSKEKPKPFMPSLEFICFIEENLSASTINSADSRAEIDRASSHSTKPLNGSSAENSNYPNNVIDFAKYRKLAD